MIIPLGGFSVHACADNRSRVIERFQNDPFYLGTAEVKAP
jgi:hypothetical protein